MGMSSVIKRKKYQMDVGNICLQILLLSDKSSLLNFFPTNLSILIIRAGLREHIAYIDMASLEILGIRDELRK